MTTSIVLEKSDVIVTLKQFVDRKTARSFNTALFAGVETVMGESPKIPLENIEPANEALVKAMIETISKKGDAASTSFQAISDEERQSFIDSLHAQDFNTLSEACNKIMSGADTQKKS